MNALVLLVALAAAPSPRVAPNAGSYVFIPRLDKLDGISAFTQLAGRKTPMFRSVVWSEELVPLIGVDVTSVESLAAAGIDPTGAYTMSNVPAGRIACAQLKEPKVFVDRGNSAVSMQGIRWNGPPPAKGVTFGAATTDDKFVVISGFVQKGNVGCMFRSPKGRGASLLEDAAKLLDSTKAPGNWKNASGLPGVMFAVSDETVIGVNAAGNVLTAETSSAKLPYAMPTLLGAGASPYAELPSDGVLTAKLRVDPTSLQSFARGFSSQLATFCPGCDEKAIAVGSAVLASELTGQVYLRVDSLNLGGMLKTDSSRYFAARHAYLAELKNPDAVKAALQKLETARGIRKTPYGIALVTQQGDIDLGIYGKHLCVSNDSAARQNALAQLGTTKPGKLSHGAEFTGDPKLVARALKAISLLDVMGSSEMAGLFAASVEMGPLLAASTSITGSADSAAGGGYRAQLHWTLEPLKTQKPDGGTP